jgi:catechol 2,3-dioxygenase-like lactoylglutathione lyase family enzyme
MAPPLSSVLETVLYHHTHEQDAMRSFYAGTLGLREVSSWPDGVCYRLGAGVVLLFDRDKTTTRKNESSRHGADGVVHACLLAAPGAYEEWKRHLSASGVELTSETTWGGGERSAFFQDPAGNLLEIAERDPWPA